MLLRQTLLYLPAQVIGPCAQVAAALVWTYWLAPGPYGVLTFLVAGQELVFLVCMSWWTHYTMRYVGGLDGGARDRFAQSEAPVFVFSFGAQVVGTLVVFGLLHQPVTVPLGLAAIAYIGSRTLLMHLGERARAMGRIGVYTMGQVAGSILGFGLAFVAVTQVSATPEGILVGFAVAQALGVALMWRDLGIESAGILPRQDILAAALRYGAPLLVAGGFTWVAQNGIRVVVERGAGAAGLGLIAVGWGLGQRLSGTLAMLVVAASFPLAVKHLHDGSRTHAYRQVALGGVFLMGLIVPASIGLCLLAEPFVMQFVAAPFRETTIAILPYAAAAGAVRNTRMHIADPVFLLIERPGLNTILNVIDAAMVLAGCAVGFALGGLVGAAAGSLAGTGLSTIAGFVMAARFAGFGFPVAHALRIAAAGAIMTLVLVAVGPSLNVAPLARMAAEIVIGAATYALAIAALYPAMVRDARRRFVDALG